MKSHFLSRRSLLHAGLGGLGLATLARFGLRPRSAYAQAAVQRSEQFLFVVTAYGGASISDSFLPVPVGRVDPSLADTLAAYPDSDVLSVPGTPFEVVRNLSGENASVPFRGSDFSLADFASTHADDLAVLTVQNTSVNHVVGQTRSVTGDGIDGGRTLMEAMSERHGNDVLIPNCTMSNAGYTEWGRRRDTPARARGVALGDPRRFALGTHGTRGTTSRLSAQALTDARQVREILESLSPMAAFADSELREHYLGLRRSTLQDLEERELIRTLLLIGREDMTDVQLAEFGLERSPDYDLLLARFPALGVDDLEAQAAMAFLLAKYGVASSVAWGIGVAPRILETTTLGTPVGFDYAHAGHVTAQNANWTRLMASVDGLIKLLKSEPHGDGSMWDSSVLYIATEFGRSKTKPAGASLYRYGSAHDLNNGVVVLSPKIRGNSVYGGIDPATLLTYGFDPSDGSPAPGTHMTTGHVYSLIAHALDIDFAGRADMSGLIR